MGLVPIRECLNASDALEAAAEARKRRRQWYAPRPEPVPTREPMMQRLVDVRPNRDRLVKTADPRFGFDRFIVGRANMLAHAAATQLVGGKPDDPVMFNPLYLYGGVGTGKTHLLHAIAAEAWPRVVAQMTAEQFMHGFASAVRAGTVLKFTESLRDAHWLLIDDVQFLTGKVMSVEFSHILNAALDAGKQVVIAADRPPLELENLDERTRSRLAGGLAVEIGQPGFDLRRAIVQARIVEAKQRHDAFGIPDAVAEYIVETITRSPRDLEGAVNRLLAVSTLTGVAITLAVAEREVRDLIRPQEPKRVKIEEIQRIVACQYNVSRADLLSSRRTANVVRPRQVAMYLAKTLTLLSLPAIGRRFGGRDHTTVLHAVRKIEGLVGIDEALAAEIEALKRQLEG